MKKEIKSIAEQIVQQVQLERSTNSNNRSIGYLEGVVNSQEMKRWILRHEYQKSSIPIRDIHGIIIDYQDVGVKDLYTKDNSFCRDSLIGKLIYQDLGKQLIEGPKGKIDAQVDLKANFTNIDKHYGDAVNGIIELLKPKSRLKFTSLVEEIERLNTLEKDLDSAKTQLDQLELDTAEALALAKEIEQKEEEISELGKRIRRYIAYEVQLRDQPILDKFQEKVKRSKILNGPLIINGGPGTGKTSSLIQRIKYLTSPTILDEVGKLTQEEADVLFNQRKSWVFYSPSELLRSYLANVMIAEGLEADESRVLTWDNQRRALLRQTTLINTETQRPFVLRKKQSGPNFYKHTPKAFKYIDEFFTEEYLDAQRRRIEVIQSDEVKKLLEKKVDFAPAEQIRTQMSSLALKIKDATARALSYKKVENWISFYINLKQEFETELNKFNKLLSEELNLEAASLQVRITRDEELSVWLRQLIEEELKAKSNRDEENEDDDFEEEEEAIILNPDDETSIKRAIDRKLKSLLRIVSLRAIDAANNRLSPRNKVLLDKIDKMLNEDKLKMLGITLYFKKHFERPLKGFESNMLAPISSTYKRFRRIILKDSNECLSATGIVDCETVLKEENKYLYYDEADFLLGFIFKIAQALYAQLKPYFNECSHPYILTFKENIKGVVAIDEATDFSLWELIAMSRLAHPLFNSVTLSGDLMQRMTAKGILSWSDYIKIMPNTEVRDLKIAYRQTAKLLRIASEIYSWNIDSPAEFVSHSEPDPLDPEPLAFIHENEAERIDWLVKRLLEIQYLYDRNFPSVAVFVKNDEEVLRIQRKLNEYEEFEQCGLNIKACLNGEVLGNKQSIRIFSIEYIKGLEFGAVFFLDIDSIADNRDELLNKFIYVGLSRANLFLGVTLKNNFSDGLEYLAPLFKEGKWDLMTK